jgi:hypothetical protein
VEPRDAADRPVRIGTVLHLSVLQDGPGGQTTCLTDWELPADLLEHAWTANWSERGYRVVLPWKTWPTADRVRVVARLQLADGLHREAEKEITLRQEAPAWTQPEGPPGNGPVQQAHASAGDGSAVQSADVRWETGSLQGAVRIRRPVPATAEDN